jgi:hypothetical protein
MRIAPVTFPVYVVTESRNDGDAPSGKSFDEWEIQYAKDRYRQDAEPAPTHRRRYSWVDSYSWRHRRVGSSDHTGSGSYSCRRPHGASSKCAVAASARELSNAVSAPRTCSWAITLFAARVSRTALAPIRAILNRGSGLEMVHGGCRRPPEGSKRGQKRRQRTQQNGDDPETPWGTRKVLVFDEDIEDLSR